MRFGPRQELERSLIFPLRPEDGKQPGDSLDIVIEDVRLLPADDLERGGVAFKIGNEHFNGTAGIVFPRQADGFGKNGGSAVCQFIPIHRGDHRVVQCQGLHGFGDPPGLLPVYGPRPAGFDRTVVAPSRADIAKNQERGGAGVPAFPSVGTTGLFTDGVEFQAVDGVLDVQVIRAGFRLDLEPGRKQFVTAVA